MNPISSSTTLYRSSVPQSNTWTLTQYQYPEYNKKVLVWDDYTKQENIAVLRSGGKEDFWYLEMGNMSVFIPARHVKKWKYI